MNKRIVLCSIVVFALGVGVYFRNSQVHANADTRTRSAARLVTVHVDGETKTIPTTAKTVEGVLRRLGVKIGKYDKTEPRLTQEIYDTGFTVNVYRARPITVTDGPNNYLVLTAERSPKEIARSAGFETEDEDEYVYRRTEDSFVGMPGTQLVILRSKEVQFGLYGKAATIHTRAETVRDFMEERDLSLEEGDEISVDPAQYIVDGMEINIDAVVRDMETKEESVPFEEEIVEDKNQPLSYREVREKGSDGSKLVTYEIVVRNGGKPERVVAREVVTKKPVKQVTVVGTKPWSGTRAEWLRILRQCEAGGNYSTNTGNGFYGAYQFMPSTWRRIAPMAGRPDLANILPHEATPAEQDYMIIKNTQLSSGGLASQNPGCYEKHGISAFPPE